MTFSVASGACSTGTATLARAQTTVNQVFAVDTETVCVKRAVVIQCSCVFLSVLGGACPCRLPGHAFPQMEAVPGAKRFGTDGNSISMYFQLQMQDGCSRIRSFSSPIHPQDIQTASSVEIVIQSSNLCSEIMFASPTTRNRHCLALLHFIFQLSQLFLPFAVNGKKKSSKTCLRSMILSYLVTALPGQASKQIWACVRYVRQQSIPYTSNTNFITALGMCKVCTEAVHSVAL